MRNPESPPPLAGLSRLQALAATRAYLRGRGIEEAEADARLLVFSAGGFDALDLLRNPEVGLTAPQAARLADFARRRADREPATRIVGRRPFWTVDIAVRPNVLDPRADSEAVVRLALRMMAQHTMPMLRILDAGSGSGALLCALLAESPGAFGVAVDLSSDACHAARLNLAANGLAMRAGVVRASWVDAFSGAFDMIVSNPPYLRSDEIRELDLEVGGHDPHLALDGGPDGLAAYRTLFSQAPGALVSNGVLIVEHGAGQGAELRGMARDYGLSEVGLERDLAGRERAFAVQMEKS